MPKEGWKLVVVRDADHQRIKVVAAELGISMAELLHGLIGGIDAKHGTVRGSRRKNAKNVN